MSSLFAVGEKSLRVPGGLRFWPFFKFYLKKWAKTQTGGGWGEAEGSLDVVSRLGTVAIRPVCDYLSQRGGVLRFWPFCKFDSKKWTKNADRGRVKEGSIEAVKK